MRRALHDGLYRYPFDQNGEEVLTFFEFVSAMTEIEVQLHDLLANPWKWQDLRFSVMERHGYRVMYQIEQSGKPVGRISVNPFHREH
jgi:hypothetical protein